jgi:hypothetical protein
MSFTSTDVGRGGGGAAWRQTRLMTAKVIAASAIEISTAITRARRLGPAHPTPVVAGARRLGSSSRDVARLARQRVFLAVLVRMVLRRSVRACS